jgi:hypothetical protein
MEAAAGGRLRILDRILGQDGGVLSDESSLL